MQDDGLTREERAQQVADNQPEVHAEELRAEKLNEIVARVAAMEAEDREIDEQINRSSILRFEQCVEVGSLLQSVYRSHTNTKAKTTERELKTRFEAWVTKNQDELGFGVRQAKQYRQLWDKCDDIRAWLRGMEKRTFHGEFDPFTPATIGEATAVFGDPDAPGRSKNINDSGRSLREFNLKPWSAGRIWDDEATDAERERKPPVPRRPDTMTDVKAAFRDAGCAVFELHAGEPAIAPFDTSVRMKPPNLVVVHAAGVALVYVKSKTGPEAHRVITEEEQRLQKSTGQKFLAIVSPEEVEDAIQTLWPPE